MSANASRRLFATDMHWTSRLLIVMASLTTLGVALAIFAVVGFIVWAVVTA